MRVVVIGSSNVPTKTIAIADLVTFTKSSIVNSEMHKLSSSLSSGSSFSSLKQELFFDHRPIRYDRHGYTFSVKIEHNEDEGHGSTGTARTPLVTFSRTDRNEGWRENVYFRLYFKSKEQIPLFDSTKTSYTYHGIYGEQAPYDTIEVYVRPSVRTIQKYAFSGCTRMKKCIMEDGYDDNKDTDVNDNDNCASTSTSAVEKIETAAFYNCKSLRILRLSRILKHISEYAFKRCEVLDILVLPGTVQTIKHGAFHYCSNLKVILLPDSIHLDHVADSTVFGPAGVGVGVSVGVVSNTTGDVIRGCTKLKAAISNAPSTSSPKVNVHVEQQQKQEPKYQPLSLFHHRLFCWMKKLPQQQRQATSASLVPSSDDRDGDTQVLQEPKQWLKHRYDTYPLHKLCYDATCPHIKITDILQCLEQYPNSPTQQDELGMTALHLLCMLIAAGSFLPYRRQESGEGGNEIIIHTTSSQSTPICDESFLIFQTIFNANKEAATMQDKEGNLPIHLALSGAAIGEIPPIFMDAMMNHIIVDAAVANNKTIDDNEETTIGPTNTSTLMVANYKGRTPLHCLIMNPNVTLNSFNTFIELSCPDVAAASTDTASSIHTMRDNDGNLPIHYAMAGIVDSVSVSGSNTSGTTTDVKQQWEVIFHTLYEAHPTALFVRDCNGFTPLNHLWRESQVDMIVNIMKDLCILSSTGLQQYGQQFSS